jgi:hypothetical protein
MVVALTGPSNSNRQKTRGTHVFLFFYFSIVCSLKDCLPFASLGFLHGRKLWVRTVKSRKTTKNRQAKSIGPVTVGQLKHFEISTYDIILGYSQYMPWCSPTSTLCHRDSVERSSARVVYPPLLLVYLHPIVQRPASLLHCCSPSQFHSKLLLLVFQPRVSASVRAHETLRVTVNSPPGRAPTHIITYPFIPSPSPLSWDREPISELGHPSNSHRADFTSALPYVGHGCPHGLSRLGQGACQRFDG